MGKMKDKLIEEMNMQKMSIVERFKYQNDLKRMGLNLDNADNVNMDDPINGMLNEPFDKDVEDFLNAPENNQEPNEMSDDSKHHGGLSYDKEGGFKAFQDKQSQNDKWVDGDDSEYDSSSDEWVDGSDDGGDDSNEY